MENKIVITDANIDTFRSLSKDEKMTLVKSIKSDSLISVYRFLKHNADVFGYSKECDEGHDFTEWQEIEYKDYNKYYNTPNYEEVYSKGAPLTNKMARICQRCGELELVDKEKVLTKKIAKQN